MDAFFKIVCLLMISYLWSFSLYAQQYDLRIAQADTSSLTPEEQGDYFKIGNYHQLSLYDYDLSGCARDSSCLKRWIWGARITNYGTQTIFPSDSVRLILEVNENLFNAVVQRDTIYCDDTLYANQANSIVLSKLFNLGLFYTPASYTIHYRTDFSNSFTQGLVDTVSYSLVMDDYCRSLNSSGFTSKARIDSQDNKVQATNAYFPSYQSLRSWQYGGVFCNVGAYANLAGSTNILSIDSVDIRYYIPSNYAGDSTVNLFVSIDEIDSWTNNNGILDRYQELSTINLGLVTITGVGTSKAKGSYGFIRVKNFSNVTTGGAALPITSSFYAVIVIQSPHLLGLPNTLTDSTAIWIGTDDYNYTLNTLATSPNSIIAQPSFMILEDTAQQRTYNWYGSGTYLAPSIGVHVSHVCYTNIEKLKQNPSLINLQLYPNPCQQYLNVYYPLASQGGKLQWRLLDLQGRVIQEYQRPDEGAKTYIFEVSDLLSGVYVLELKRDGRLLAAQEFVKQ